MPRFKKGGMRPAGESDEEDLGENKVGQRDLRPAVFIKDIQKRQTAIEESKK